MPENTKKRGLKRKRVDDEQVSGYSRLTGKLHHGLKEVKKSAKISKTHETQKLVKRLKGARSSTNNKWKDNAAELESELEIVKRINHEQVAATALKTKINKNHLLRNDDEVQNVISSQLSPNLLVPAESGSALAKVQARLLSSKLVANAAVAVVQSILRLLHPESVEHLSVQLDLEHYSESVDRHRKFSKQQPTSVEGELEDEDEDAHSGESESDENELRREASVSRDKHFRSASDDSGVVDVSVPSDDDSAADDPSATPGPESSKGTAASKPESTFLPSLSVGFVRGDSDSDFSDGEADSIVGGPRKNRRGQRARRAIWEKKFGKNANHIKKGGGRGSSLAARGERRRQESSNKPSKDPAESAAGSGGSPARIAKSDKAPGVGPAPYVSRTKPQGSKEERPLHPSWEAKKKLKEQQSATIVPPQGKKIKF